MSEALIDSYDAALFDLDGVIYLGPAPVPGAAEGIAELRQRSVQIGFVTNNAARTPASVAQHLTELGVEADTADVVTSSQAGARLLAEQVAPSSKVLVIGTEALAAEVAAVGFTPVSSADADPAAVIQGYHPQLPWKLIDDGAFAIQNGALWIATNMDSTRPTDRGLVPGAGAQITALRTSVDVDPIVAGKPCAPLMEETTRRLKAKRPIFVGDRLDTDVAGAETVGMDSLMVLTGAHGKNDLLKSSVRPTYLGQDLRALLQPARRAQVAGDLARCNQSQVSIAHDRVRIDEVENHLESQLDALWALLQLVWPRLDRGDAVDASEALAQLNLVR